MAEQIEKKIVKKKKKVIVIAAQNANSPSSVIEKKSKTRYLLEHFHEKNEKTVNFIMTKMFPGQFSAEAFERLFSAEFVYRWWLYSQGNEGAPWVFEGPYVDFNDAKEDGEILVAAAPRKIEVSLKAKITENMNSDPSARTPELEQQLEEYLSQLARTQKLLNDRRYRYDIRAFPQLRDFKSVLEEVLKEYEEDIAEATEEEDVDILRGMSEPIPDDDDVVTIVHKAPAEERK